MKTYLTILFICCLLFAGGVFAQCPTGDYIMFDSQQAVDNFPSDYPNCTEINGNLGIIGFVNNLDSLNQITSISGNLEITYNTDLISLSGLYNLNAIGGTLQIDTNPNLTDLSGLENLNSIGGSLFIMINDNLNDLSALGNLNTVGGDLWVDSNPALTDLSGLENLNSIEGTLDIVYNDNLTNLSGLENIDYAGITKLQIQNNPALMLCGVEGICDYLSIGSSSAIGGNAEGCNNTEEIIQSCFSVWEYIVVGNIFMDENEDCSKDPSESGLSDWTVTIEGEQNTYYAYTYNNGRYVASVDPGIYTVTPTPPNALWEDVCSETDTAVITSSSPVDTLDFGAMLNESAQCPEGDFVFGSQQAVDNFPADYPNCTEINANVTISGTVSNLDSLNQITSINGHLEISFTDLTNFSGLENLNNIGGDLSVDANYNLIDFSGLDNLNNIGGDLYLLGNSSLVNFSGLENLNTIGGSLSVQYAYFNSLQGLENLNAIGGSLQIDSNLDLTDLLALGNLSAVGGDLFIFQNYNLINLSGLENLNTIGGELFIDSNSALSNLSGLENLNTIGGDLWIAYNNNLTDLSGLENIDHTNLTDLDIRGNTSLSLCGIESICNYLIDGGTATIDGNAEGCNTAEEIIQSCASVWEYAIEGNIFIETDTDCLQDSSESGLDGWIVKAENQQDIQYAYTYDNGKYVVPADAGTYIITPIPPNSLWEDLCFERDTAVLTPFNTRDTLDFGASTATFCPLLEIDVTAPFVRRCFDSNYYVRYCNSGTAIAENAYVEVQLDPFFTYQNSTIASIDLGENLYSFDLGNVNIGECGSFRIDVYVDCDSTEIGQTHCVEAHIYPDSICTPSLPLWDESSIMVDAQCLGDSIEFKIKNIGVGDMSDSLEYLIVEDDLIWHRANFQLDSGENRTIYKPANGAFYRLEAEQSPGHPGNSMPSVFVEGCGTNDDGEISVGFVNYYLLDEGDAFVSIDCQENIGSYDPNDKQAFPVGYGAPHFITDSTDLEYLIRFQNTGTDTAFNIVIRDTISPHLNIETLRPGVASHDYRYDIEGSNIAVFHFENIMLPDSNINEAASHGFIKFNIEQQGNNPIGTHIMNDAAIYFDFNEPIITNTVFHTVGEDFMGIVTSVIIPPELEEAGVSVYVFPNPFDEYTRFEVQGEVVKELHLSVYDMMGREVLQQKGERQQHITLHRNNLTSGVYVFRLMDEKRQLATGKLVIE